MIGHVIGNYKILERIGEGGMGTVYKGVDQMLEREVAVKVLRADLTHRPKIVERFRSEAVTLARVHHPNVAMLYSFLREGDEFFMIMEFVRGRPLDELIERSGALPLEQAVHWFGQSLDGIHHAHRLGIVHRDIKPANIMITDAGIAKVMDFGIARVLGETRMTRTGHLIGTLEYMSPEQILGQDVDARSDIYALGILLYEMLTGQVPFQADSDYDLMRAQVEQSPRAPGSLMPYLPAPVEQVVLRALEKDPARRFQTAAAFREALEAAVGASARSGSPPIPVPLTRFVEAPDLAVESSVEEAPEVPTPEASVGEATTEAPVAAFLHVPLADVVEETPTEGTPDVPAEEAADEEVVVEASAEETLAAEAPVEDAAVETPTMEASDDRVEDVAGEASVEALPAVDEPAPVAEKLPRAKRVASEPEPPVVEPRPLPLIQRLNAKHYAGAAAVLILLVVGVLALRPGSGAQDGERGAATTEENAGEGNEASQQETGGLPPDRGDPAWSQDAQPARIDADIPGMLAQARQYFEANQLTTPAGENAQETCLQVLQLDPDNAEAVELLQQIAQRYAAWGDTRMQSGETDQAVGQYQKGLAVAQSHPGALEELVVVLQRRLAAAEARLAAEETRASVRNLVSQAPDYQPDPEQDPPPFVEMIEEVQREIEQVADPVPQETPQQEQGQEDPRLDALVAQARSLSEAGNDREALPLFREAAEQGHADAQYSLGLLYREGRVVDRIDAEAMTWFRKAAEQGHADAQFFVGWMYWRGQGGVASDDAEAVTWYCKAAAQGHERAQRVLTRLGKDC